jgi:hypothetical protein
MLNGLGSREFWITGNFDLYDEWEIDSDTSKWVRTCPIYRDSFESNYPFRFFELEMRRNYSS